MNIPGQTGSLAAAMAGLSRAALMLATSLLATSTTYGQLTITEVMYNPNNDSAWEWIEVRNTGAAEVDMEGWLAFNLGANELSNPTPTVSISNATTTIVPAGGVAVIYDGFHGSSSPATFDANDQTFRNAWGVAPSTVLIAGNFFPGLSNSSGSDGQTIGFWKDLTDYQNDIGEVEDPNNPGTFVRRVAQFNNTQFNIDYRDGFPADDGMSSMTWTGNGDAANGANWVLSQAGQFGATTSVPINFTGATNGINEVANPGRVTNVGTSPLGATPEESLRITEIMYDSGSPTDDAAWEWVELFNPSATTVDLAGWVIDDANNVPHGAANIAAGSIPAGGSAILFNVDSTPQADFETAWGASLNLIPVTGWGNMQLNNGGDTISLWKSFAEYDGNHNFTNTSHANAVLTQTYTDDPDFPDSNNMASITLNDLGADPNDGFSWDLSFVGDSHESFNPQAVGDTIVFHPGGDIGSPGTFEVQPVTLAGDFDGDNDVDDADFAAWEATFGGSRDAGDFLAWQRGFGSSLSAGQVSAAAVPEPVAGLGAVLALLAGIAVRRG
jgi:hypothetical protein